MAVEPAGSAAVKSDRPFRVLCIDGGGIRGVIPAVWLKALERELGERDTTLAKSFDLVCGTSTGAILAAAVACNIPMDRVISMYEDRGPAIFRRRNPSLPNLFGAKYAHKALADALKEVLGNTRLRDAKTRLCIPAYDIGNRHTYYFRSYNRNTRDIDIVQACLSSASAPTYFPPYAAELPDNITRHFVDGGVSANNPSGVGLAEAIALQRVGSLAEAQVNRPIQLVALGTGSSTRDISDAIRARPGLLGWAPSILDVMFDGSSDVSAYITAQILEENNYIRLQFELTRGSGKDDMDNAAAGNLIKLKGAADAYIEQAGRLERVVAMIVATPPS